MENDSTFASGFRVPTLAAFAVDEAASSGKTSSRASANSDSRRMSFGCAFLYAL